MLVGRAPTKMLSKERAKEACLELRLHRSHNSPAADQKRQNFARSGQKLQIFVCGGPETPKFRPSFSQIAYIKISYMQTYSGYFYIEKEPYQFIINKQKGSEQDYFFGYVSNNNIYTVYILNLGFLC